MSKRPVERVLEATLDDLLGEFTDFALHTDYSEAVGLDEIQEQKRWELKFERRLRATRYVKASLLIASIAIGIVTFVVAVRLPFSYILLKKLLEVFALLFMSAPLLFVLARLMFLLPRLKEQLMGWWNEYLFGSGD